MSEMGTGKQILDSRIGSNNVVYDKLIDDTYINTFDKILDTLSNHCGPYGKFAMIYDINDPIADPVFTKDGINIVRAMEFMNPLQRSAHKLAMYIGSRIESSIGDGTTSAMITSITALKYLREVGLYKEEGLTHQKFKKDFNTFKQLIAESINYKTFTIDKLQELFPDKTRKELVKNIAYHQAYTSSHGNHELATVIAEVFSSVDERGWDYIGYERWTFETEKEYSYEVDKDQYTIEAKPADKAMFNNELGTTFECGDCDLVVFNEDIMDDSFSTIKVKELINKYIEGERELVIIAPFVAYTVSNWLLARLQEKQKHNIKVFTHSIDDPRVNDLVNIALISDTLPNSSSTIESTNGLTIINGVQCSFFEKELKLNKLFDCKVEDTIHPFVNSPDHVIFNHYVDNLLRIIKRLKNDAKHSSSLREAAKYEKLYSKLILINKASIRIGGNIYDNVAAIDVVADVVSAVKKTLKDGFVFGGGVTFVDCLSLVDDVNSNNTIKHFINAFQIGLNTVLNSMIKFAPKDMTFEMFGIVYGDAVITDLIGAADTTFDLISFKYNVMDDNFFESKDVEPENKYIIQPKNTDIELIDRFGEVALRFLMTKNIIPIGGVYET